MTTKKQKKGISLTVAVLAGVVSVILGIFFSEQYQIKKQREFLDNFSGTVLTKAREIQSFSLKSTDEKSFNNAQLKGHWTMMFFGFTHCPVLCPTTMTEVGKMYKILEKNHIKKLPQVVMVSIDPDRDSLSKLKNYVKGFDAHFIGARGSEDKINAITKELGIVHMKEKAKDNSANYNIQHSGAIMVFNPQGQLKAFFAYPHKAQKLASDYTQLVV